MSSASKFSEEMFEELTRRGSMMAKHDLDQTCEKGPQNEFPSHAYSELPLPLLSTMEACYDGRVYGPPVIPPAMMMGPQFLSPLSWMGCGGPWSQGWTGGPLPPWRPPAPPTHHPIPMIYCRPQGPNGHFNGHGMGFNPVFSGGGDMTDWLTEFEGSGWKDGDVDKRYPLSSLSEGHILIMADTKGGSKFLQQKIQLKKEDTHHLYSVVWRNAVRVAQSHYGNFLIRKFVASGTPQQQWELGMFAANQMDVLMRNPYSCRLIMEVLEHGDPRIREVVLEKMRGVGDLWGEYLVHPIKSHVIQSALRGCPRRTRSIHFILDLIEHQCVDMAVNEFGSRVLQTVLERCREGAKRGISLCLVDNVVFLSQDPYGNYVVQKLLEFGSPQLRRDVCTGPLMGHYMDLARHKHGSNVVEACLHCSAPDVRALIINHILDSRVTADERSGGMMGVLLEDAFGNYVVQRMLEVAGGKEEEKLLTQILPLLKHLGKFASGKHIRARLEKYIARKMNARSAGDR